MGKVIWEAVLDALIDSAKLLPFLFITYLLMEFIEHKTTDKTKRAIEKSGRFGPVLGSFLGAVPQCGFSAMASNLYAGRIITMGTLIAIFLSTSDEMLPILISSGAPIVSVLQIIGIKICIGIITGVIIDLCITLLKKANLKLDDDSIKDLCKEDGCHCEEDGIFKAAIKHTVSTIIYILIITLIINVVIEAIGEDKIANFVSESFVLNLMVSCLIGLIPNCASSIVLTDLYISGILSLASMIAGLLTNAGVGLLVLFKENKPLKNNICILLLMYVIGVVWGLILHIIL